MCCPGVGVARSEEQGKARAGRGHRIPLYRRPSRRHAGANTRERNVAGRIGRQVDPVHADGVAVDVEVADHGRQGPGMATVCDATTLPSIR